MKTVQIDTVSFRCQLTDDDIPFLDAVQINGVWVNPDDYLATHVVEAIEQYLSEVHDEE